MGVFAAGAMLFWGTVAVVPIALHLLRRRRRRTVSWGAMRFLESAIARRANKRFQLWHWLLLVLRVLAVLAIAIALARPLLPSSATATSQVASPGVLRVLVIDSSYSMQTRLGGSSRFDVAQSAAVRLCESAGTGDGFLLLRMESPPQPVIPEVSFQRQEVIAEIERLVPGDGGADLTATFQRVQAMIAKATDASWRGPIEVTVMSDLQRSTWQTPLDESLIRSGAGDQRSYRVVDCAADGEPMNIAATDLQRESTGIGSPEEGIQLLSSAAYLSGQQAAVPALVQLAVDGVLDQSQRLSLTPGQTQVQSWSARLSPGRHVVETRIGASDSLAVDNTRRRLVSVPDRISVALFGAEPNDTRYVALAAAPPGDGIVDVQRLAWDSLSATELDRFDVWVLCNPPAPRSGTMERIGQYLEQGGGVVWWLGPAWTAGAAVPLAKDQGGWSATRQIRADEETIGIEIDPLGYRSPIVAPFEPFPGSGLLTLPVFEYWRLRLEDPWQTALAIRPEAEAEGALDPLVATLDSDSAGRQVVIATAPGPGGTDPGDSDAVWNAIIAWPAFVPLVQEVIVWASRAAADEPPVLVGQEIRGVTPESQFGAQLVDDAGHTLAVRALARQGQMVRWRAEPARYAGLYRWNSSSGDGAVGAAVNVDTQEGNLQRIDQLAPPLTVLRPEAIEAAQGTASIASAADFSGREIAWWVLMAAVGMLCAEAVLVRMLEARG